ncbi:MAG: ankyrin repeat domain-containing protein [Planctomycetota bacterium]
MNEDAAILQRFLSACINNREEACRLAKQYPTVLRTENEVLHWLIIEDHSAAVALVLELGCEVGLRDSLGRTALCCACASGRLGCARILLAHGAAPDSPEPYDQNALDWAVLGKHMDVVVLLLEHGAKADYCDSTLGTVFRSMASWAPKERAVAMSVLEKHGVTREAVFQKHRLGELFASPEEAFLW